MSASIRADIVRLHKRYGFTGLYVTHDQNEALMLGHRVAVMDSGYLVQVDTPGRLLDYPHTLQVAKLLSAPALNLLDIEPEASLPADCRLAIRASSFYELGEGDAEQSHGVLPAQVLGQRHLVGGMLYRAALSETATLPVASEQLGRTVTPWSPRMLKRLNTRCGCRPVRSWNSSFLMLRESPTQSVVRYVWPSPRSGASSSPRVSASTWANRLIGVVLRPIDPAVGGGYELLSD